MKISTKLIAGIFFTTLFFTTIFFNIFLGINQGFVLSLASAFLLTGVLYFLFFLKNNNNKFFKIILLLLFVFILIFTSIFYFIYYPRFVNGNNIIVKVDSELDVNKVLIKGEHLYFDKGEIKNKVDKKYGMLIFGVYYEDKYYKVRTYRYNWHDNVKYNFYFDKIDGEIYLEYSEKGMGYSGSMRIKESL